MIEEVTTRGQQERFGWTAAAAEEVTEFIGFPAKPVGCIVLLEPAHTSDPSLDPAMILLKSIVQVHIRPVRDFAAQR